MTRAVGSSISNKVTPVQSRVEFSVLDEGTARTILARNWIGRLAYSFRSRVDLEPIGYVVDGDWICGRTSPGSKLAMLDHQQWCAFEVDEVQSMFDWTSVVVHGSFHVLREDDDAASPYQRTLAVLRAHDPNVLSAGDRAAHRTILFRIFINEISGRGAEEEK
jgi:nitroimidazol reductase NimA-like FMN-containing flavoprotein (pyridoxamine 5'-phosphate oxidase superfamily)